MSTQVFVRPPADPGTRTSRMIALVAAFLLGGFLLVSQNLSAVRAVFEPVQVAEGPSASSAVPPPWPGDPLSLAGRFAIQSKSMPEWLAGDPSEVVAAVDVYANTPEGLVRGSIIAAELLGTQEAIERLEAMQADFDAESALAADVADLLTIYSTATDDLPVTLPPESAQRLVTHHGYFGEVALSWGLADTDPTREPLVTGGGKLFAVLMGLLFFLAAVAITGFVMFIVAAVLVGMGKVRSGLERPEPGGSVFLETFAIFAGGFLLLVFGIDLLVPIVQDATWLTVIQMLAQWLLLACPLWPLLRGMRWNAYCKAIGWHRGKGVLREMGCGVLGYLAGLPLLAMGLGIALLLVTIVTFFRTQSGLGPPPPPSNAVFELAASQNPVVLIAVFLLATVWAPLCEESIFRGALYRHFRGRAGIVISAIGSAFIFGLAHQYGPVMVMPVVMLGVTFALMREWRGSLIAPITAHALHNATVTIMLFTVLRVIG